MTERWWKTGPARCLTELVETIEALIDRGILFVAASGRSLISLERLFAPIKEKIYYAACNGTLTGRYRDMMFTESVDPELLKVLIEEARGYGTAIPFLTDKDVMYSDSEGERCVKMAQGRIPGKY